MSDTPLLDGIRGPADVRALPEDQLPALAEELRKELLRVVYSTGGHLGSNLGVVELTIALHHVFDAERDTFVWDVSNQTYPHKMLTGRRDRMGSIRQYGGLAGFGNRQESKYDPFTFGHAGTAASTAIGIASANRYLGRDARVVAVVGDGAMTEGMSYEALNNAGWYRVPVMLILNDNSWSIGKSVGGLTNTLTTLRTLPPYEDAKKALTNLLSKSPVGAKILDLLTDVQRGMREAILPNFFTDLGLHYYGPIDGHNLPLLVRTLKRLKGHPEPVLLHVVTQKGRGDPAAGSHEYAVHAVKPKAPPKTKEQPVVPGKTVAAPKVAYTTHFARKMIDLGYKEPKLIGITAAMPDGTGLIDFGKVHPDRYIDVGICEQHAVGYAAGLAHAGMKPVAALYSTFLQRAYDSVFQEVCVQNVPVVIAMDRGGIAGNDGPTHNGLFDIAYLRTLPNITLLSPKDGAEFSAMLEFMLTLPGPSAIRYPRGNVPDFSKYNLPERPIEMGRGEVLIEGRDVMLLAYGSMTELALTARDLLAAEGWDVGVANARFVKPVDHDLVRHCLTKYRTVLTLEEHSIVGGFGSAVLEAACALRIDTRGVTVVGVHDEFLTHGDREKLMEVLGIDAAGIARRVKELGGRPSGSPAEATSRRAP